MDSFRRVAGLAFVGASGVDGREKAVNVRHIRHTLSRLNRWRYAAYAAGYDAALRDLGDEGAAEAAAETPIDDLTAEVAAAIWANLPVEQDWVADFYGCADAVLVALAAKGEGFYSDDFEGPTDD